jgi:hypothetical protein
LNLDNKQRHNAGPFALSYQTHPRGGGNSSLSHWSCTGRYGAAASIIRLLATARAKARIVTQGDKRLAAFTA